MQISVMSEGLLLNSKYIKMGREEGGFQALPSHTHFLNFFLFRFLLVYVIISFYKNYFIIIIILFIYFHENYFYFFMFRDVPECSGLFQHVQECSMFRLLSTPVVRSP